VYYLADLTRGGLGVLVRVPGSIILSIPLIMLEYHVTFKLVKFLYVVFISDVHPSLSYAKNLLSPPFTLVWLYHSAGSSSAASSPKA
jgi:hypothetical protein